jgi:ATP-dependent Lhr-like helicase
VIVDEIHSLVANKRGSHLFVSLERLEELRRDTDEHASPLQRIGLSATQRPLEEIARLLGGGESPADPDRPPAPRPRRRTLAKALPGRPEVGPVAPILAFADEDVFRLPAVWPQKHTKLSNHQRQKGDGTE